MKKTLCLLFALALCCAALSGCMDPEVITVTEYVYEPQPTPEPRPAHSRFIKVSYEDRAMLEKRFPDRFEAFEQQKAALDEAVEKFNATSERKVEVGALYDIREGREGSVLYPTKLKLECPDNERFAAAMCWKDGEWQLFPEAEVTTIKGKELPAAMIYELMNFAVLLWAE